jgi:hypothetical protein
MLDIKDADRDVGYEIADIASTSLVPAAARIDPAARHSSL